MCGVVYKEMSVLCVIGFLFSSRRPLGRPLPLAEPARPPRRSRVGVGPRALPRPLLPCMALPAAVPVVPLARALGRAARATVC